jgi:hypothetical protein
LESSIKAEKKAVAEALKRFGVAMAEGGERKRFVSKLKNQTSNI